MEALNLESSDGGNCKSSVPYKKLIPISSKVTSVLSTSFSDSEFCEALSLFDQKNLLNDAKGRRQIRLELQRDVMECNGLVIDHFGRVAEVCILAHQLLSHREELTLELAIISRQGCP